MSTNYQKKLAATALAQFNKYSMLRENQEPLTTQIRAYWEHLGFAFPGVETAWSGVFISWCVKTAGATSAQFKFSAAHSEFMHQAIANADAGAGVFRGRELTSYAPKVGDILQNNRAGNQYDFAYAKTNTLYESHSAIVVEVGTDSKGGYLRTVGGNESDSVGLKAVRLDKLGLVKNPGGLYIAIIETLL